MDKKGEFSDKQKRKLREDDEQQESEPNNDYGKQDDEQQEAESDTDYEEQDNMADALFEDLRKPYSLPRYLLFMYHDGRQFTGKVLINLKKGVELKKITRYDLAWTLRHEGVTTSQQEHKGCLGVKAKRWVYTKHEDLPEFCEHVEASRMPQQRKPDLVHFHEEECD